MTETLGESAYKALRRDMSRGETAGGLIGV